MTVKFVELPSLLFQLVFGFALCRRWDEDGSGELEFEEHQLGRDEAWMWGNGGMNQLHVIFIGAIDRQEFMRPNDGLADMVLATMHFLRKG